MSLHVVILSAGKSTRMCSSRPKALHVVGNKPILAHIIETATALNPDQIHVVYGYAGEVLLDQLSHHNVNWIKQSEQKGTGHALQTALPSLEGADRVLVLVGDTPLISLQTLQRFLADVVVEDVGVVTAEMENPHGLGRVIHNEDGSIAAIVEQRDADDVQAKIKEINSGILLLPTKNLQLWLSKLSSNNQQQEYYLTEIIQLANQNGINVRAVTVQNTREVCGINTRTELAQVERLFQRQQAEQLMLEGVTLKDPARFDLRGELEAGKDIIIDVNVVLEGQVSIGNNSIIEPNCVIRNSRIGDNVVIKANSVLDNVEVGNQCSVGPFANLRPGTKLADGVRVGNFVEIKQSYLGEGSKASHLSYIGDAIVGTQVNIGAGTITCNYDGVNKHQTTIEDYAFIGSDCQLVAPVTVGRGATLGAGTTLTKDAPADQLTVSRTKQTSIANWVRPIKED